MPLPYTHPRGRGGLILSFLVLSGRTGLSSSASQTSPFSRRRRHPQMSRSISLRTFLRLFVSASRDCASTTYVSIPKRSSPLEPNNPHPRIPHPTQFRPRDAEEKKSIRFRYISAIDDSQNLTCRVKTEDSPSRFLIVKFSDRYGYEAHEHLAIASYASQLFYCGLLDGVTDVLNSADAKGTFHADIGSLYSGPLRMIVMEYLEGENAYVTPRDKWPGSAYEDLKAAFEWPCLWGPATAKCGFCLRRQCETYQF
ncbi:hypothetical protein K435DRAFT_220121 [Dendrothele bispora CBS 962.96]|uniref:Uncharacterized protein n=1 Tax=Dendrothele bispora (strain CBS 962.96) TaxID=1314807 RepID=A0A4S8MMD0_DENBC|nr:hypothetical protein K435DRAFT_220121 [Dendrothele bispora CBS 962.96]